MRGVLRSFVLVAVASICVACSDLGGLTGGDEPAPGGPRTGESGGGDACSGDGCLPSPADVIYVAEGGNDTNDGKSPRAPKKTIGGAIALLKTTGATSFEVHVCRGTYLESVTLDFATSLRGGYECSTWKRADGNETIIQAPAVDVPALAVRGVTGVAVEGFTVRASEASARRSIGVLVGAGASVTLTGDRILGGGGETKLSPATAAVYLENGGAAEIVGSFVEGGSATLDGGGYGSAGVAIGVGKEHDACALTIRESEIRGGTGAVSSGTGSVAILALYGSAPSIEKSTIFGGAGKSGAGTSSAGAIVSTRGDVSFVGNEVDGGAGSCTGDCTVLGASLSPSGKATILGNRIIGGEVSTPGNEGRFVGLGVNDSPAADIQNNEIFTGNTKHAITSAASVLETRGLGNAFVGQNTLVLGSTLAGTGIVLTLDAKQGTVANNLLVNAGGTPDYGVRVNSCKDARVVSFRNNAWAGFADGKAILAIDETNPSSTFLCTTAATTATTAAAAESALESVFPDVVVAGNQRLAASAASLFGAWNEPTANDLFANGWKLAPTAPCSVVKGSGDVGGLASTDLFGAARTDPRSIGAAESDGQCQ